MTPDFRTLVSEIGGASGRTKGALVACALALAALLGGAGWIAGQPHFVTLYSGLGDAERVAVEKALAGGEVKFRVSQPPGPFVVYVDEDGFYEAQNLVALSEALKHAPVGIASGESGAASIFLSSGERQQGMLKREWQEMERQLETLDFVSRATVTTSTPDTSPLRQRTPPTVSVTLQLRGLAELSGEQAASVAKLIRFRFNVPAENVVISDQSGRTLFDADADQGGEPARELLEHSAAFDRELAQRANATLELAFGKKKALVTLTSEWDLDQRTTLAERLEPKGVVVSEEKTTSKTPQGASAPAAGGPAGTASNLASEFGSEHAGVPSAAASEQIASTSDEKKVYETSRSTTQTVHTTPELKRLFVSLLVDESLAAKKDEIAQFVKNAVGFSDARDSFSVGTTAFAAEEVALDADGKPLPATDAAPAAGPSRTVELLVRRGVEIVAALGFLFLLFKTLKGATGARSRASGAKAGADDGADADSAPDPELVARMQIEELVRTDPRRVGEILSRWAGEETTPARAAR